MLLGGKVRVVKNGSQVAVLYQFGEVFGELSALGDEIRTASVIAVEATRCLELSPDSLQRLPAVERDACYASLYRFIAQVVAERLKKTTDELVQVTGELEITRRKLAELRRKSNQEPLSDELALAIEQLRRTKEKLSRLGRAAGELPPA
ncbi:MAG: cyclic nucleotide-binding domain-containing protein [Candidatus Competibacter sp.]